MIESKIRIKHNRKLNCKVKPKITQKIQITLRYQATQNTKKERRRHGRKKAQHRNHYWSL